MTAERGRLLVGGPSEAELVLFFLHHSVYFCTRYSCIYISFFVKDAIVLCECQSIFMNFIYFFLLVLFYFLLHYISYTLTAVFCLRSWEARNDPTSLVLSIFCYLLWRAVEILYKKMSIKKADTANEEEQLGCNERGRIRIIEKKL